jgi:hypothetical protein
MPVDHLKDIDQREWPLDPVENDAAKLVVTRTRVTRDVGLPTQTATDTWEAEIVRSRVKILVAQAPTMAEFDAALNTWRQAIVDARATLAAMNA